MRNADLKQLVEKAFKEGFPIHDPTGRPMDSKCMPRQGAEGYWHTAMAVRIHFSLSLFEGDGPAWPNDDYSFLFPDTQKQQIRYERDAMLVSRHIVFVGKDNASWITLVVATFKKPVAIFYKNLAELPVLSVPFQIKDGKLEYHPVADIPAGEIDTKTCAEWISASTLGLLLKKGSSAEAAAAEAQLEGLAVTCHGEFLARCFEKVLQALCRMDFGTIDFVLPAKIGNGPSDWTDGDVRPDQVIRVSGAKRTWFRRSDALYMLHLQQFGFFTEC